MQALSQSMDRLLPSPVDRRAPAAIRARNDLQERAVESLPRTVEVVHGEVPEIVVVREGPWSSRPTSGTGNRRDLSSTT